MAANENKATVPTSNSPYPIDFTLMDKSGWPVLAMTNASTAEEMVLTIINTSKRTLQFISLADKPAAYHFTLTFLAGTLRLDDPSKPLLMPINWDLSVQKLPDNKVIFRCRYTGGLKELKSGESFPIEYLNLIADGIGGARTCRIEFETNSDYVAYADNQQEKIAEKRSQLLSLVNHKGRQSIPLHASFIGCHTILNDTTSENKLILSLRNVSKETILTLKPDTVFTLRFAKDFASKDQMEAIKIAVLENKNKEIKWQANQWTSQPSTQYDLPAWIIKPTDTIVLQANETIEFKLTEIRSSGDSGISNLYLHYENIENYWDGHLSCELEKAPLLYVKNNIGLGTVNPTAALHVVNQDTKESLKVVLQNNKANENIKDDRDDKDNTYIKFIGGGGQKWDVGIKKRGLKTDQEGFYIHNQVSKVDTLAFHEDGSILLVAESSFKITNSTNLKQGYWLFRFDMSGYFEAFGGITVTDKDSKWHTTVHMERDGSLYRYNDGHVYLTVADHFYIRQKDSKEPYKFHFDTRDGSLQIKGKIEALGGIALDNNNPAGFVPAHIEVDGSLYRHDGQVYLTVDDNFYIRQKDSKEPYKFHFNTTNGRLEIGGDLEVNGNIHANNHLISPGHTLLTPITGKEYNGFDTDGFIIGNITFGDRDKASGKVVLNGDGDQKLIDSKFFHSPVYITGESNGVRVGATSIGGCPSSFILPVQKGQKWTVTYATTPSDNIAFYWVPLGFDPPSNFNFIK